MAGSVASSELFMLACIAGVACTPEAPAKPAAPVHVGAVEPGAPAEDPTAADPAAASSDAGSQHPPTGYYEITARVIADNCRPAYKPPSPWSVVVQAGAEPGRARVNVPLGAIPPSNATHASGRTDVTIEPRRRFQSTWTPMPACPSYTTERTFELVESGPAGFTVAISVDHGDSRACSSAPPSKCTTKVEYAYKLVQSLCAAECTRGIVFGGDGGATPDCRCP